MIERPCLGPNCDVRVGIVLLREFDPVLHEYRERKVVIDLKASDEGTIILQGERAFEVGKRRAAELIANGNRLYVRHLDRCPDAEMFRSRRKAS